MTATAIPATILCATDLSGRCDRALDRAALLARDWHAKLVLVHALETMPEFQQARRLHDLPSWRRPEDRAAAVARELHADMVDVGSDPEVVVAAGEPAELILVEAARRKADLIVTGVARSELFGRRLLGATVDTLIRRAPAPVLVVRGRARRPYRQIVVATDFSAGSRGALETAVALFGPATTALFHAYRIATGGVVAPDRVRGSWQAMARQEADRFLAGAALDPAARAGLRVLVEEGDPVLLLRDLIDANGVDLVVCGASGRIALLEMLIGSTAQRLVEGLPCDVLVVRPG